MAAINGNGNGTGSGSGVSTVWAAFSKLDVVQEVLDRNRALLEEIRGNHSAAGPNDLARNCVLIKELNGNIAEVQQHNGSRNGGLRKRAFTRNRGAATSV